MSAACARVDRFADVAEATAVIGFADVAGTVEVADTGEAAGSKAEEEE